MRLKRRLSEAEFSDAVLQMPRPPSQGTLEIAHADLVRGLPQSLIAKEHKITVGAVSSASKRVWLGFLKSKGLEEITVVLPIRRAFMAKQWSKEALKALDDEMLA